jgi:hypothetical protein
VSGGRPPAATLTPCDMPLGQRRKDFAFVNYEERANALKAIDGKHGFEVQGTRTHGARTHA